MKKTTTLVAPNCVHTSGNYCAHISTVGHGQDSYWTITLIFLNPLSLSCIPPPPQPILALLGKTFLGQWFAKTAPTPADR